MHSAPLPTLTAAAVHRHTAGAYVNIFPQWVDVFLFPYTFDLERTHSKENLRRRRRRP